MSRCTADCNCPVCVFRRMRGVTVCPPATAEADGVYRIVLRGEYLGDGDDARLRGDGTCYQCGERFAVGASVLVENKRREFCGEKCLTAHQNGEPDFTEAP